MNEKMQQNYDVPLIAYNAYGIMIISLVMWLAGICLYNCCD